MTRVKWTLAPALIALVLPLTADASGILNRGCAGGNCAGGHGIGGNYAGGHGGWGLKDGLHNHPCPNCAGKGKGNGGLGLFQPPFQAAPWYLYWPYDQHFQTPAPIGGPYFAPPQLASPMNPYFGAPPMPPHAPVPPPPPTAR